MKKVTLPFLMAFIGLFSLNAQDLELKAGIAYPADFEKLGIQVGAQYGITEEIDLAGGLSLFFPDKTEFPDGTGGTTEMKSSLWMLDVDGHYNFDMGSGLNLYPLAGLNFTGSKVKSGNNSVSSTYLGLNIGGGAQYALSETLKAMFEVKYIAGDADQAVIGLGVIFGL